MSARHILKVVSAIAKRQRAPVPPAAKKPTMVPIQFMTVRSTAPRTVQGRTTTDRPVEALGFTSGRFALSFGPSRGLRRPLHHERQHRVHLSALRRERHPVIIMQLQPTVPDQHRNDWVRGVHGNAVRAPPASVKDRPEKAFRTRSNHAPQCSRPARSERQAIRSFTTVRFMNTLRTVP
jgi:hypothetical protein